MKEQKRVWDYLNKDERRKAIDEIIEYFRAERGEAIGILAAENILDFFLSNIGGAIYNKAIDNAKDFLAKELDNNLLNLDISLRKK